MKTKLDTMTHAERAAFARSLYRGENTAAEIGKRFFLERIRNGEVK